MKLHPEIGSGIGQVAPEWPRDRLVRGRESGLAPASQRGVRARPGRVASSPARSSADCGARGTSRASPFVFHGPHCGCAYRALPLWPRGLKGAQCHEDAPPHQHMY
eukprot:9501616-Pyramimonas_sp.AAC.1